MVVIVPLPYIYNMTNPSKNKKRFFKGAGLRPSASGERHEIIFSPSFGLIYNMLKNSKSVTLFCYFFQKKSPRLSPGQSSKETTTITNRRVVSRKEYVFFFIFIGSRLHVICRILVRIDYRPAAR